MTADDFESVLALNNAHAIETSPLDVEGLTRLVGTAFRARVIGALDAFCIALDQTADHDGQNYKWFRARYDRFVYVDRIVVSDAARGQGLAHRLYEDLFHASRDTGHTRIVCEVNIDPPNPASTAFHARLGFLEVGQAVLSDRGKVVRYLVREL